MTRSVTVRHNFETAHRLPFLPGKCENLHGHSWWVEVTVEAPGNPDVVVEFGRLKAALRGFIDANLDHGVMLGKNDPLLPVLREYGKVYEFGREPSESAGLDWPTVENVAEMLSRAAYAALQGSGHAEGAYIARVHVSETHVNGAEWTP